MSLLVGENVSLYYGERPILDGFSFRIEEKDRVGLVGRNGSGKTSLLRLVTGEISPTKGDIRTSKGVRLGYLSQDAATPDPGVTVLASVVSSVPGRTEVDAGVKRLSREVEAEKDPERQAALAEKLAGLLETQSRLETLYAPHAAEKILTGLGFTEADFSRPLMEMSGGWRTRAALGALLFQNPDVLLLDEPTNHLDADSVHWLDKFLEGFAGALVLVSHDREFLNRQIQRLISFEPEGLRQYKGNFDSYEIQRAEEEKILDRQARNQDQKVKEAMKFVERFRSKSTKARQAQSKLKVIQKMEVIASHKPQRTVRFRFPPVPASGRQVMTLSGLSKSFGENCLYENLDLHVEKGDRVAIIGRNGTGKTTLLKMMAGELAPDSGKVSPGHGVTLSYYAQHQAEQLNPNSTVVEEVSNVIPDAPVSFVRGVCGAFLFSGDEVDKPVSVLSGGERARVALGKLLAKPGNCLLMDEPTNHLDIVAAEKLVEALLGYDGTLVFVSHNQAFVNRLATVVWDIRSGHVETYPGTLREYYDHMDRVARRTQAPAMGPASKAVAKPAPGQEAKEPPGQERNQAGKPSPAAADAVAQGSRDDRRARKKVEAEARRRLARVAGPLKKKLAEAEAEVARLEALETEMSEALCDPKVFSDGQKSSKLLVEYGKVKKDLGVWMFRWEKTQEELEALENEE
ncbi:MAG: ATP-binding cassette domain-containing protein [Proteobacteria bacterium]|nr:ATP-binding cassette domain-containing protein [Pseudomonadota bacterium]